MIAMMDVLQCLGVQPEVACGFAASIARNNSRFLKLHEGLEEKARILCATTGKPTTFFEVYGQGRIIENAHCRDLNIQGLQAMDLRANKPDGSPWNFD